MKLLTGAWISVSSATTAVLMSGGSITTIAAATFVGTAAWGVGDLIAVRRNRKWAFAGMIHDKTCPHCLAVDSLVEVTSEADAGKQRRVVCDLCFNAFALKVEGHFVAAYPLGLSRDAWYGAHHD